MTTLEGTADLEKLWPWLLYERGKKKETKNGFRPEQGATQVNCNLVDRS